MASKHGTTQERPSVAVKIQLRAGINDRGKQAQHYVYQITGLNTQKVATVNKRTGASTVYDWLQSAVKPYGRTDVDKDGHFAERYSLTNGVYRVTQPNAEYIGWPVTEFAVVKDGQIRKVTENEARALFGLAPKVVTGKSATPRLAAEEPGVVSF